jgi:hypothetical protein
MKKVVIWLLAIAIVVSIGACALPSNDTCTVQVDTHLRNRAGETSRAVGPVLAGDVLRLTGSTDAGWLETDAGWIDGELCK